MLPSANTLLQIGASSSRMSSLLPFQALGCFSDNTAPCSAVVMMVLVAHLKRKCRGSTEWLPLLGSWSFNLHQRHCVVSSDGGSCPLRRVQLSGSSARSNDMASLRIPQTFRTHCQDPRQFPRAYYERASQHSATLRSRFAGHTPSTLPLPGRIPRRHQAHQNAKLALVAGAHAPPTARAVVRERLGTATGRKHRGVSLRGPARLACPDIPIGDSVTRERLSRRVAGATSTPPTPGSNALAAVAGGRRVAAERLEAAGVGVRCAVP